MSWENDFTIPRPLLVMTIRCPRKTLKMAKHRADEFLRRMMQILDREGLTEARIYKNSRVIYRRKYPFSWAAFVFAFVGIFIMFFSLGQIVYAYAFFMPYLIACAFMVSFVPALMLGLCGGLTWLYWHPLRLSEDTQFLYLNFDVTCGDTYMVQILNEIGMPYTYQH